MKLPALKAGLGVLRALPLTKKLKDIAKDKIVDALVNKGVITEEQAKQPEVINKHTYGLTEKVFERITVIVIFAGFAWLVKHGIIPADVLVDFVLQYFGLKV